MHFEVAQSRSATWRGPNCYLIPGDWDDWFRYETTFYLVYVDDKQNQRDIGTVKIGQFGMGQGFSAGRKDSPPPNQLRSPQLPDHFEDLSHEVFFSLGQDVSYYEALNDLGPIVRDQVLLALNDLALTDGLFQLALREPVTLTSLLRFVPRNTVEGQFRRIARGGAPLSRYTFAFTAHQPARSKRPSAVFDVDVIPESHPPTNIQVLIGRNGVGKTRLLNGMARDLLGFETDVGSFEFGGGDALDPGGFSNVVSVSFSAFDSIEPLRAKRSSHMKSHYVGLKRPTDPDGKVYVPKSPAALAREFSFSVLACLQDERRGRWQQALHLLESDPVFAGAGVAELADTATDEGELRARAMALYRDNLSSGHKIVLLTVTKLVETVAERSLVLLDEPEAHLHPPLLSAFIRALSDLLVHRNAVAIVATHSPVVLQEVPKSCVWVMQRVNRLLAINRPTLETFGEGVGVLTHEVFGLEVTKAGFHRMLDDAVDDAVDFDELITRFDGQLGGEARGIARGLLALRDGD